MNIRALGLVLLALLAACGEGDLTQAKLLAAREQRLRLPRVGQVGQEPPDEWQIRIRITKDATVHVGDGPPLSIVGLREELQRRLKAHEAAWELDGTSAFAALLDVDASIPWMLPSWVIQACAHPEVKIYKIFFGAVARDSEQVGALATRLWKGHFGQFDPPPIHSIRVCGTSGQPSDPEALHARLLQLSEEERAVARFTIRPVKPEGFVVPSGTIVQILDVLFRAGVTDVEFWGVARAGQDRMKDAGRMAQYVRTLRDRSVKPRITLDKEEIGSTAPAAPALGRSSELVGMWVPWPDAENPTRADLVDGIEEQEITETMEVVDEAIVEEPDEEAIEPPVGPTPLEIEDARRSGHRGRDFEDPVDDALAWLTAHQTPQGAWEAATFGGWCDGEAVTDDAKRPDGAGQAQYDVGVTGLALLAYLGAGYTPRGKHQYTTAVSRGVRYLRSVQGDDGCFGKRDHPQFVYNHAIATLAMIEAFRGTQSPISLSRAKRALVFLEKLRNPQAAWRYGMRPGDNDTSVTSWMAQALESARRANAERRAAGKTDAFEMDPGTTDGMRAWVDRITDPQSGRAGYITRGAGPARGPQQAIAATLGTVGTLERFPASKSASMTAAAMWLRLYLGEDPEKGPMLKKGAALLVARLPTWSQDGSIDLIYWYYGTPVMFAFGGKHWDAWKQAMEKAFVASQRTDTTACQYQGSWDPIGAWGGNGGRVYATALMAMCLQIYYRYDRINRLMPEPPEGTLVVKPGIVPQVTTRDESPVVGVLLAGGSGQRMHPLTNRTNKHLIPVHMRPMIEYSLGTLLNMGLREICVVTGRSHMGQVVDVLGSGRGYGTGVDFTYKVQDEAGGIAQALGLTEAFAAGRRIAVVLGDNVFDCDGIFEVAHQFGKSDPPHAVNFLCEVPNPDAYGVATVADGRIVSIVEKPKSPESNLAVTGLYLYPSDLYAKLHGLTPSARGELEITDVNNLFVEEGRMHYKVIDGWFDAGEPEPWMRTQNHVAIHPERFGDERFRLREDA